MRTGDQRRKAKKTDRKAWDGKSATLQVVLLFQGRPESVRDEGGRRGQANVGRSSRCCLGGLFFSNPSIFVDSYSDSEHITYWLCDTMIATTHYLHCVQAAEVDEVGKPMVADPVPERTREAIYRNRKLNQSRELPRPTWVCLERNVRQL